LDETITLKQPFSIPAWSGPITNRLETRIRESKKLIRDVLRDHGIMKEGQIVIDPIVEKALEKRNVPVDELPEYIKDYFMDVGIASNTRLDVMIDPRIVSTKEWITRGRSPSEIHENLEFSGTYQLLDRVSKTMYPPDEFVLTANEIKYTTDPSKGMNPKEMNVNINTETIKDVIKAETGIVPTSFVKKGRFPKNVARKHWNQWDGHGGIAIRNVIEDDLNNAHSEVRSDVDIDEDDRGFNAREKGTVDIHDKNNNVIGSGTFDIEYLGESRNRVDFWNGTYEITYDLS